VVNICQVFPFQGVAGTTGVVMASLFGESVMGLLLSLCPIVILVCSANDPVGVSILFWYICGTWVKECSS
jgi:hypothetical protein